MAEDVGGGDGRVVVAVDGSEGGRGALRWAVAEARLRRVPLDVVHVWHTPHIGGSAGLPFYSLEPEDFQGPARHVLATAASEATALAGGAVDVRPSLREGLPASELLAAAAGAAMLVVGSRGLGGFRGLLLGSVSQQVLQHAPCPVVVVRPPAAAR